MMLLGAVVLVIGFLILTGITARLTQIPQETAQGTGDLLQEAKALQTGFFSTGTTPLLDSGQQAHARQLMAQRGFVLTFVCGTSPDTFTLSDGTSRLTIGITNLC